jgi:4'-phosphopantetheinyl transferase
MTSWRQFQPNRPNALKSTGARTEEGKRILKTARTARKSATGRAHLQWSPAAFPTQHSRQLARAPLCDIVSNDLRRQFPHSGSRMTDASCPKRLAEREVHVSYMALDSVAPTVWPRWSQMLDDSERDAAARFVFEADRQHYIAAHALTRTMLSSFACPRPQAWRFVAGAHGKPAIHPDIPHRGIEHNLSHTRGAVACAVTLDHPIGIDIENTERANCNLDIANTYFAADEIAQLRAADPAQQRDMFFTLWTLRKAYIKAIGLGMNIALDQFAFSLTPLRIRFGPALAEDPGWQFQVFRPTEQHILSVAIRAFGTAHVHLREPQPDDIRTPT